MKAILYICVRLGGLVLKLCVLPKRWLGWKQMKVVLSHIIYLSSILYKGVYIKDQVAVEIENRGGNEQGQERAKEP